MKQKYDGNIKNSTKVKLRNGTILYVKPGRNVKRAVKMYLEVLEQFGRSYKKKESADITIVDVPTE